MTRYAFSRSAWAPPLIVAALCALPASVRAQEPERITLDEAIRRALRVQPAMVQSEGNLRTAAASRRSAMGAYLPTLTTNYSASQGPPRVSPSGDLLSSGVGQSMGLSASVALFNGFRREALIKASGATRHAMEAALVSQEFAITRDTKQTFYNALANAELVRVAEAQLRRAQQQHNIAVEKLRAGSATRSDSLRTRVELGNAQLSLLQAKANLASAEANLGRAVGADGPVRPSADSGLAVQPVTVDTAALRLQAQSRSPLVEQREAEASAAGSQVTVARAQYWPTVNLSYADTRTGGKAFTPWQTSPRETWTLSFSWTLFNGFTREATQVSADVTRDVAEATAADARRQVDALLTQQLAAMEAGRLKIEVTQSSLTAAEEDLRVQQQRYQVGASTILELLNSQVALSQAEVQAIQARYDYLVAKAQVEALIGRSL